MQLPGPASRKNCSTRPDARCDAAEALQPSHRANLLRLGGAVHPLPRTAAPARDGGGGGERVSHFPRPRWARGRLDQNQALSALLFLYKQVLKQEFGWLDGVERAKKPVRLPVVLTRDEVHKIFAHLQGTPRLMAGLLYGSGLRLMECVRLRIKDVDFGYARIVSATGRERRIG